MIRYIILIIAVAAVVTAQDFESGTYCNEQFTSCTGSSVGCPVNTRNCSMEIRSIDNARRLEIVTYCDGNTHGAPIKMDRRNDRRSQFMKTCSISSSNGASSFSSTSITNSITYN